MWYKSKQTGEALVGVKSVGQLKFTFVDHGTDTYRPSAGRLVAVHYLGCAARVICFCLAISRQMASCVSSEPREYVCRFRNCAERYIVCKNINGVSVSCSSLGQTRGMLSDWLASAVLQFSMVTLWWLADEWGVPKISKIPTTHLLLGVGLVGIGQVSSFIYFQVLHLCKEKL